MTRLSGRTCLVTGVSSGIGAACAARFAQEGATVAGLDLTEPADGGLAGFEVADVRDEAAVIDAVRSLTASLGGHVDVLVNAAGVAGAGPAHLLAEDEWARVIGVNLTGTFLVSKHVVAGMFERRSGSIINLASIEGLEGMDLTPAYNASKGGVVLLTRQMAIDYGRAGIRVNCLCPGFIDTPMTAVFRSPGAEGIRDQIAAASMLARFGQPEEVAGAALFLASDDASFVTGHALVVDGGLTAGHRWGLGAGLGL